MPQSFEAGHKKETFNKCELKWTMFSTSVIITVVIWLLTAEKLLILIHVLFTTVHKVGQVYNQSTSSRCALASTATCFATYGGARGRW